MEGVMTFRLPNNPIDLQNEVIRKYLIEIRNRYVQYQKTIGNQIWEAYASTEEFSKSLFWVVSKTTVNGTTVLFKQVICLNLATGECFYFIEFVNIPVDAIIRGQYESALEKASNGELEDLNLLAANFFSECVNLMLIQGG